MFKEVKIIANYLPQFYENELNNSFWGKGYTDWVGVKKAKPMFSGHVQPKIPLNGYYKLDEVDEIRNQAICARKAGIYGFSIYHYWFNSSLQALTKPPELILDNSDIDINFLFIWDNHSWKRTWDAIKGSDGWLVDDARHENKILAELDYGDQQDWKKHFEYLLPYFKDSRYIKIEGKPVFGFYQVDTDFVTIEKMSEYWNSLAIENGFPGMVCMSRDHVLPERKLEYVFRYMPFTNYNIIDLLIKKVKEVGHKQKIIKFNYDFYWKRIIANSKDCNEKKFNAGVVMYDDTPRRGKKAKILVGASPSKFGKYMEKLILNSQRGNSEFIFLTAWNEWGEGAYLEPDTVNKYEYLEALRNAIDKTGAWKA